MSNAMKPVQGAPVASSDGRRYVIFGFATAFFLFGGFVTWSALARIDSAVIASGVVSVETNRKAVQHLEGGIVREVLVREMQKVREGDVLVRLSPVQAESTVELHHGALDAALALEARLMAEQKGDTEVVFPKALLDEVDKRATARKTMDDQLNQFRERRAALTVQVDILQKREQQLRQQLIGYQAQLTSAKSQLKSLEFEYSKLDALAKKSWFPLNRLMDMSRRIDEQRGRIGQLESDLAKTDEGIREVQLQMVQVTGKQKEEVAQGMRDVRVTIGEVTEKIRVARDVHTRTEVRAPVSGTVIGLKFHNIGAVVRPGEPMMDIVPEEEMLVAQVRVSPLDINYIQEGMEAEVRFPGIRGRRIPVIMGRIRSVAQDSLRDDATKEPYFIAVAAVRLADLPTQVQGARMIAGMPVEVIIPTGERTVMDFWISPLHEEATKWMREK